MREKTRVDVKKRQFLLISHSYGPSKLCPPPPLSFLLHSPPHQLPCEKHLPSPLPKRRLARLELFRSANLLRVGIGRAENNQLGALGSVAAHLCTNSGRANVKMAYELILLSLGLVYKTNQNYKTMP